MDGHLLQKLLPHPASLWFRFSIQAQEVQQYHKMPHPSEFGKDTKNKKNRNGHHLLQKFKPPSKTSTSWIWNLWLAFTIKA